MLNTKELLAILTKVKPGISDKTIVESMTYFYFSGEEVVTYNDKISVQHPLKTDFKNIFVKADDLFKLVSLIKTPEVKFTEKNDKLNVRTKNMNVNLTTIFDEEIVDRISIIRKSLKSAKWKKVPSNFLNCINLCAFAASKTDSDSTRSCVYINDTSCSATDNNRIAIAKLDASMNDMFIKASEISNLNSIEPINYACNKAWLHFKNEQGCTFSIRRIKGSFDDFSEVVNFKGIEIELPLEITEGSSIASIFVDTLNPSVTLKITKNLCEISVNSEGGNSKHRTKIKYDGKDLGFTINPEFLEVMLKHSTTIVIDKLVKAQRAKLITDNFTLVTSLHMEE